MVKFDLKRINKATAKGRTYYYPWRKEKGSNEKPPRLVGEPGSPEFIRSYYEAVENRRTPDMGRARALVTLYKASADYKALADSTKRNWGPWLDRIADYFGDLRIAQFDRPEKIRPIIRRWRNQWANKPRTADYGMQVLSRVLSYAVDPLGKVVSNPCEGIKQLYSSDRSEIIWTDADIALLKKTCSLEIAHVVDLAAHTGLRLSDVLRLAWSHVGEDSITLATGKSRGRREAIIPLYDDLRAVLARIPKRATTILTSTKQRPWTVDGFGSSFNTAKREAGITHKDLHFHDLRGTAATKFYIAGLRIRVIAEILAWSEDQVERIIRRYVARAAATKAAIRQLNEARK
jgi:integrase